MSSVLTSFVLVVLSPDRPGLVERISALVADHGGNWLESHLSSTAGFFGGILNVSLPTDQVDGWNAALEELAREGFEFLIKPGTSSDPLPDGTTVEVSVVGNDRPGIVSRISEAIAGRGINVTELDTEYTSAPMSGNAIFRARASLVMPVGYHWDELKSDLERIANDLMVDLDFGAR